VIDYTVKTGLQLGSVLRGYRKNKGFTQQQIGAKTGLPQPSISQMEANPGPMALSRLLKVLSVLDLEFVVREKKTTQEPSDW
jgi:HTH-type transcriptional regulator/antitoxin HipB